MWGSPRQQVGGAMWSLHTKGWSDGQAVLLQGLIHLGKETLEPERNQTTASQGRAPLGMLDWSFCHSGLKKAFQTNEGKDIWEYRKLIKRKQIKKTKGLLIWNVFKQGFYNIFLWGSGTVFNLHKRGSSFPETSLPLHLGKSFAWKTDFCLTFLTATQAKGLFTWYVTDRHELLWDV